jgi:hypothetical protein
MWEWPIVPPLTPRGKSEKEVCPKRQPGVSQNAEGPIGALSAPDGASYRLTSVAHMDEGEAHV